VETHVAEALQIANRLTRILASHSSNNPPMAAVSLRERIVAFRQHVPLAVKLAHPGMKQYHWEQLSKAMSIESMDYHLPALM